LIFVYYLCHCVTRIEFQARNNNTARGKPGGHDAPQKRITVSGLPALEDLPKGQAPRLQTKNRYNPAKYDEEAVDAAEG